MATTNRETGETSGTAGPGASTGEVPAPARSFTAVALAMGLYGLLLLMTVVYELSLGDVIRPAP
ncbi:MAG: hypothetical protein ACOC8K_07990 [Gemmatimonadota bacterium]